MGTDAPSTPEGALDRSDSDAELLGRVSRVDGRSGDGRALSLLVERYKRLVYSVPVRLGLAEADCDDVFQNTFVALARHAGSINDPKALPKWLMQTARRECWSVARARGRARGTPAVELSDPSGPMPASLEAAERLHAVEEALAQLGGRCEKLIRALFVERTKPDYVAIGARLGIPVGSIGPTRARCLAKLLELLPGGDSL